MNCRLHKERRRLLMRKFTRGLSRKKEKRLEYLEAMANNERDPAMEQSFERLRRVVTAYHDKALQLRLIASEVERALSLEEVKP